MTPFLVIAAWIALAASAPFIADFNDNVIDHHIRRGFDWPDQR